MVAKTECRGDVCGLVHFEDPEHTSNDKTDRGYAEQIAADALESQSLIHAMTDALARRVIEERRS